MAVKLTCCCALNYSTTWSSLWPTSLPCSCSFFCGGWEKREPLYQGKKTIQTKKNHLRLGRFYSFSNEPWKGASLLSCNIWPDIKRLSIRKGKTLPHKAFPHSKQGSQNFLLPAPNAQNVSSASPALANMPLCTLESNVSLLAQALRVWATHDKCSIKSFNELQEDPPVFQATQN